MSAFGTKRTFHDFDERGSLVAIEESVFSGDAVTVAGGQCRDVRSRGAVSHKRLRPDQAGFKRGQIANAV
jgi:hypothetical protein